MPPVVALLLRTFVIGVAVAAPVGAMGVLCIQRTLAHGWRAGVATGAGIATADGIYAGLAAFGVAAVSQSIVTLQNPLRLGGGLVLLWLGWRAMASPPAHDPAKSADVTRLGSLYASSVALTLTNPMTVMAFGAVFASAGLVAEPTAFSAGMSVLGVAAGSLSWWLGLTSVVALMRHAVSDTAMRRVNRASGAVVFAFGAFAAWTGASGLLG